LADSRRPGIGSDFLALGVKATSLRDAGAGVHAGTGAPERERWPRAGDGGRNLPGTEQLEQLALEMRAALSVRDAGAAFTDEGDAGSCMSVATLVSEPLREDYQDFAGRNLSEHRPLHLSR